uniref:XRCC4 coiled-coil domain-containing protein n=1 Tax=Trichobilharzia regenti TaxID=157069 RepID=A0AA85JN77_TRIRE|nr:unnamed protein product [Trichobilharzia regenti]
MQIKYCGQAKVNGYGVSFLYESGSLLVVAHKDGFWCLLVDGKELDVMCDSVKQSREHSTDPSRYFSLSEDGLDLKFVWSKEIKNGIKIVLGSFRLQRAQDTLKFVGEFTFKFVAGCTGLLTCLQDTKKENEILRSLAEVSTKRYKELVSEMEDKETVLLSKFSAVLNEKKRTIDSLKRYPQCMSYDNGNAPDTPLMHSTAVFEQDADDLIPPKSRKLSSSMVVRSFRK